MLNRYLKLLALGALYALLLAMVHARHNQTVTRPAEPELNHRVIEGVVAPGESLGHILAANGIPGPQAHEISRTLNELFNLRRLRPGDRWHLYLNKQEEFQKLRYHRGPIEYYLVGYDPENGDYYSKKHQRETIRQTFGASGTVETSLYEAMTSGGVSPERVIEFAEIFASRIDFFTEPRRGDEFTLAWDALVHEGERLQDLRITAAAYHNAGKNFSAFYFEDPAGVHGGGYFDESGDSLESAFLRAPLNYRRISSHFSHRRFHPIHRVYRPHLGIDYAAPTGTPVSAIGNGRVTFVGWQGGFGNTIKVEHPNGYTSYYGHLSRFASGLSRGRRVRKGEVIGYVGATGTATGPHLDFRMQTRDGRFVNFLALKLPPSRKLTEAEQPLFQARRAELADLLAAIPRLTQPERETRVVRLPAGTAIDESGRESPDENAGTPGNWLRNLF